MSGAQPGPDENRAHRDAIRGFTRYVGLLAEKHTRAVLVRLKRH